jgi:FAD binding domain
VGVAVERGVELVGLASDGDAVSVRLRGDDGREEATSSRFVVGCDGAHSAVREAAGIGFEGGSYPQTFVLADAECDGIERDAAHAFLSDRGLLFFFPLGTPASWRLLAMRPPHDRTPPGAPVLLNEVQALADTYTAGRVRLHDPVWMTNFRLHHRAAVHYRAGRVFLAGDAAHVHSPAGGQGMNTGIQDAVNLGWKLAHVLRGWAKPAMLDTYEQERAPVGRRVLRFTDRAFTIATSTNPLVRFARARLAPALIPMVFKSRAGRAAAFRTISELGIRYRDSALSLEGPTGQRREFRRGPRAGDRLPDGSVLHDGRMTSLHSVVAEAGWHLLLCGLADAWRAVASVNEWHGVVAVHRISTADAPNVVYDPGGKVLRRLGLGPGDAAHYLVRPDGHIGYRSSGTDLTGLDRYLRQWLSPPRT